MKGKKEGRGGRREEKRGGRGKGRRGRKAQYGEGLERLNACLHDLLMVLLMNCVLPASQTKLAPQSI